MLVNQAGFGFAPYRLSGTVYGVLLNHVPALASLGEAVHAAPYKAPPKAPVLYVKPRNTLAAQGSTCELPVGAPALHVGANLGIVVGRAACRVPIEQAGAFVAGYVIVNDWSVPHDSFYRPSVRFKAIDDSCVVGVPVPSMQVGNPDALIVRVFVDGELVQRTDTGARVRPVAQLLADITDFMTLAAGDIVLLGTSHGAPLAGAGQRVVIEIEGLSRLECAVGAATAHDHPMEPRP